MRAKLRRRQRKQQTPISRAERLDAYGCREPSNQNRPKQVKLDDPDYIYVEDDCASAKRVDHPKSSQCFRGDLKATMAHKDYCVGSKPVSDGPAAATEDKDDLPMLQYVSDVPATATDDKDHLERAQCVDDDPPAATDSEDDFEKTQCVDDDPLAATDSEDDFEKMQCVDTDPPAATDSEDDFEKTQCVDDDPLAATEDKDNLQKPQCVSDVPATATVDNDGLERAHFRLQWRKKTFCFTGALRRSRSLYPKHQCCNTIMSRNQQRSSAMQAGKASEQCYCRTTNPCVMPLKHSAVRSQGMHPLKLKCWQSLSPAASSTNRSMAKV